MGKLEFTEEVGVAEWPTEQRLGYDRRRLSWRTFARGCVTPRRRRSRRNDEHDMLVDWHEPHLLFLALSILFASITDAFLTLMLMTQGAEEVNPILHYVLHEIPTAFALIKLLLTSVGVIVLVAMARATVFRRIRVSSIIHVCLAGYLVLIAYECWLLAATT